MPTITLYRKDGACSMVPHILLRELAIPHRTIVLSVTPTGYAAADGSFSTAEYKKIHPAGYVPALGVDGFIITENPAILRYIASLAPERKLFGVDALQQARVEEWLSWLAGTVHGTGFGAFWRPARFTEDKEAYAGIVARGREKIVDCYAQIEGRIQGPWVVGEGMTVVDVYLHTFWRWGVQVGFEMGRYQRYGEVMRRVEGCESVRRVMREEGEEMTFGVDGGLRVRG